MPNKSVRALAAVTALSLSAASLVLVAAPSSAFADVSFTTPGTHEWIVPDGISSVDFNVCGAQGGSAVYSSTKAGGLGALAVGALAVTAGETLTITVGGVGGTATSPVRGISGANGGGAGGNGVGGSPSFPGGGGGGGATDIRQGGSTLASRVVVAGGGGGATAAAAGGAGGGVGSNGAGDGFSGKGAATGAGGLGGSNSGAGQTAGQNGTAGNGGGAGTIAGGSGYGGGGGGGGLYGGGGGTSAALPNSGSGGGGSSLGPEGVEFTTGVDCENSGNGAVTLSEGVDPTPTPTPTPSPTPTTTSGIALRWAAPRDAVTGYNVQISTDAQTWSDVSSGECSGLVTATTCFVAQSPQLVPGNRYTFRIFSVTEATRNPNGAVVDAIGFNPTTRSASADDPLGRASNKSTTSVVVPVSIWQTWTTLNDPYRLCISGIGESIGCKDVVDGGGFKQTGSHMKNSKAKIRSAGIVNGQAFNVTAPVTFTNKKKAGKVPSSMVTKIVASSPLGSTTTKLNLKLTAISPKKTRIKYDMESIGTGFMSQFVKLQNTKAAKIALGQDIATSVRAGVGREMKVKMLRPKSLGGTKARLTARVTGASVIRGTVTFWQGSKALCNATVKSGKATCKVTLSAPLRSSGSRGDLRTKSARLAASVGGLGSTGGQSTPIDGVGTKKVYLK